MKKLIIISLVFLSCKKELTQTEPDILLTAKKETVKQSGVAEVASVIFNPCTNEVMQLSGLLRWQVLGNIAEFHYAGVTAVGLTTGNTYQAMGHQVEQYNGGSVNFLYKIMFPTPGGQNNLSQTVSIHFNGNIEHVDFGDPYCQ